MLRKTSACALLAFAFGAGLTQPAPLYAQDHKVEAEVLLPQTGEKAGQHNPPCGNQVVGPTAADVILRAGAAAIDAYIGQPLVGPALEQASPGNQQWLKDRLGLPRNGPSTCATQCVIYPIGVTARILDACLTESGTDGSRCYTAPSDHDAGGDHQYGRVENFTYGKTQNANVFCATGKNWSHNRNRRFLVRAIW